MMQKIYVIKVISTLCHSSHLDVTTFKVDGRFKVSLSQSKKGCFICFNESPLKMMKNGFYVTLKAAFGL